MLESIGVIIGFAVTISSLITSVLFSKKAKKAEVRLKEHEANSKEIATADQMIDLVKKANAEVYELYKKENDKLRKTIIRLEKAVKAISTCPYRDECPVTGRLQDDKDVG